MISEIEDAPDFWVDRCQFVQKNVYREVLAPGVDPNVPRLFKKQINRFSQMVTISVWVGILTEYLSEDLVFGVITQIRVRTAEAATIILQ